MATAQEIFDKVARHLHDQNKQAASDEECLYLAPDGSRCAVGCLIPDGHPGLALLGDVGDLFATYDDLAAVVLPSDLPNEIEDPDYDGDYGAMSFLYHLQDVHDNGVHWTWFPAEAQSEGFNGYNTLRRIANDWGLDSSVVDALEADR